MLAYGGTATRMGEWAIRACLSNVSTQRDESTGRQLCLTPQFAFISALCPSYRASRSRWEGPIITMLRQCAWGALRAARSRLQADGVAGNGSSVASAQAAMPALSNLIRGFAAEPAPVQSASEGTVTQVRGIQV